MRVSTAVSLVSILGLSAAVPSSPSFTSHARQEILTLQTEEIPSPPEPEPIEVVELPLPPVVATEDQGACTAIINPNGTGCIGNTIAVDFSGGGFLPDGNHVLASMNFTGAPAAPDPASIYNGTQLVVIKVDGTAFSSGSAWKCITCGVPDEQQVGRKALMDYPQSFKDGKRVLVGPQIVDCGDFLISSEECTPSKTHIFPIHWNNKADGSGPGGSIREQRVHPDDIHFGFSSMVLAKSGSLSQYAYFSRLEFNTAPTSGTPLAPRYDLINTVRLFNENDTQPVEVSKVNSSQLVINHGARSVGELRGFSADGKEVTYIGSPDESSNIDVYAADLTTGAVRRLTSHPEYVDPVDLSPDNQWHVVCDTRGTGRQMFIAGMRGIPPLTDLISVSVTSSTRNNGRRRFFNVILLDRYGDRGEYIGQKVNAEGDGSPDSVNDPQWNARADPKWSPDGTKIAYWQELTVSPDCGGANPLPCPVSRADGGRVARFMVAHLTSRSPVPPFKVETHEDNIPWGVPYSPTVAAPERPYPPAGIYTLPGNFSGEALVNITENAAKTAPLTIGVTYNAYSDDGETVLEGTEEVTAFVDESPTLNHVDWYSNLTSTRDGVVSTKVTGEGGFHLDIDVQVNEFVANGSLTTTIDGKIWLQPRNYT